jgi:hypothetical protein
MANSDEIRVNFAPAAVIAKYTPYLLKGMHEYHGVEYMSEKGDYQMCNLCQTTLFNMKDTTTEKERVAAFKEHVRTLCHETRYFQLWQGQKVYISNERTRRLQKSNAILNRISQLNSAPFKSHMNDLVVQFIDSPLGDYKAPPGPEETRRWKVLTDQLASYEEAESKDDKDLVVVK